MESLTQSADIDLVLLDLTMPRMDGHTTLTAIDRDHSQLPVLLMSGYGDQETTQQLLERDHSAFIQKPFTTRNLATMIARVLV